MSNYDNVPFIRTAYNYDRSAASADSGLDCEKRIDLATGEVVLTPSLTKQSFAEEADINVLVRRFGLTGQLPENVRMPTYGDFEGVSDFHEAMNAVRLASESFMAMPAHVRERFANDPGRFVDFCSDPSNRDEAVKLGLVPPPVEPKAAPEAAPPPAPAPAAG